MIIEVKYLVCRGQSIEDVEIVVSEYSGGFLRILKDNIQYIIDSVKSDIEGSDRFNRYFTLDTEDEHFKYLMSVMDPEFKQPILKFIRKKSIDEIL